jgi:hypothetical protein
MNMSIGKLNIASGLAVEKIGVNNLDLYIPRINEKYSENEIKFIFVDMGIGTVDYVDFVATKDPETKQIKYYSAFIRLMEWRQDGYWYKNIIVDKLNKISITRSEFWMILPAKTPLARSKVNTHQLAAYTDELFVRVEAVEKKLNDNITVSSEHFKNLLAKSEAQAAQIEQLMKIVQIQSEQLVRINNVMFNNEAEETIRPRALTIEDLAQVVEENDQISCEICSMEFDTEKQLYFHETVCKKEMPDYKPDDDDCFLSNNPKSFRNYTENVDRKRDIISGSFSINLDDLLDPLARSLGISKEQAEKQLEKEIANSQRAVSSRNYCGNE